MRITKSIRYKSQAILLALLLACFLLLLNFIFNRHFVRLDLTADKEYSLSPATKTILKSLDDRMIIKLYFTEKVPSYLQTLEQQIYDLLDEYRVYSASKIAIEKIIPESSPQSEQETQILGIPPLQLSVFEKDKREVRKVYLGIGIFYGDKKEIIPVASDPQQLEYGLTSSILKLVTKEVPKLGLYLPDRTENNQNPYEIVRKVLEKQMAIEKIKGDEKNIEDLNLTALLIIEPKEISETLKSAMDPLLNKGTPVILLTGSVLVKSDLSAENYNTGLEDWLKSKGVELSSGLLIEPKNPARATFFTGFMQYSVPYPFFVRVDKEGLDQKQPITSQLEEIVFPWTHGLKLHAEDHPDLDYEILAQSSSASFAQEGEPEVNPEVLESLEMKAGEKHPLAVLIRNKTPEKNFRLLVVGNSRFVENNFLSDYEHNLLFLQNMADWVSWGDQLIGIRSRGKTSRPIPTLSESKISFIRWIHLLGVPLLVIGMGLVILFLQRRRYRTIAET